MGRHAGDHHPVRVLVIGKPEEYVARIVDSATQEHLVDLPWSQIKWQRVESDSSEGSVFIAEDDGGIECCGEIGGLMPWSQMLQIERDGRSVWDGPILGWGRPGITQPDSPRGVTIRARDRFWLSVKRNVGFNITGTQTPAYVFFHLLNGAGFGGGLDPFPFAVPAATAFLATSDKVDREYKVDRLERVYDCVKELVEKGQIFFTMVNNTLYVNEPAVRGLLGGAGVRPKLSDETVVGIPGIDVDGSNQITTAYGGASSEGKNGFPVVSTQTPFAGVYQNSLLEGSINVDRSQVANPLILGSETSSLDIDTAVFAARNASPAFTMEQLRLSPALEVDIMDLLPGVVFDIDFESTCAFNVPFMGVEPIYRYWYTQPVGPGQFFDVYAWMATPVYSDTVAMARLSQLDVTVTKSSSGWEEEILASLGPTAEFTYLPAGWIDPYPDPTRASLHLD